MTLDREIFLLIAQDEIENLLSKNGFDEAEFIRRDQDGKNDIIFIYSVIETEFDHRWKTSIHVNFENYKEDLDFSNIEITGYIVANGGDIFAENAENLKDEYLKIKSFDEKRIISQSLDNDLTKTINKKRI